MHDRAVTVAEKAKKWPATAKSPFFGLLSSAAALGKRRRRRRKGVADVSGLVIANLRRSEGYRFRETIRLCAEASDSPPRITYNVGSSMTNGVDHVLPSAEPSTLYL